MLITAPMMNKKKRKLRAPIASLSDKQFLLNTPITNNETPKRGNHSMSLTSSSSSSVFPILNRHNLTYTPMTRKLLQKQQAFACNKYAPHLPAISFTRSSFPILVDENENININIHNNININNNNINITNNINTRRKKKRKFAEMEADNPNNAYNTPNIPGSVRKKRRLNSNSSKPTNTKNKNRNRKKTEMTSSAKKKVMKKVLNNEFNPSLSISFQSKSPSISIINNNNNNNNNNNSNNYNKNKNENELSMILDFTTPSKSVSHPMTPMNTGSNKIIKKRRLSASRDSDIMLSTYNSNSNSSSNSNTEMISRRRRRRQSFSSNAIKKASKRPIKKLLKATPKREISPFDAPIPHNVKKTYKRRNNIVGNRLKSMPKYISKSLSIVSTGNNNNNNKEKNKNKNKNKNKTKNKINICPLITQLIDRGDKSQIAFIAYHCLSLISSKMKLNQQNIFRKFDGFLCLLSRAEIILKNDEQTRLQQIHAFNNKNSDSNYNGLWGDEWKNIYQKRKGKKRKNKNKNIIKKTKTKTNKKVINRNNNNNNKRRVHFCCYDMSTVTTPYFGELDSIKHLQTICRLLVQSGSMIFKLFRVKSDNSLTRKTIKMFIDQLKEYQNNINKSIMKTDITKYLIKQFEDGYNHEIAYPFCIKISNLLSSLIRFYLKTIWNASEFLDDNNNNNKNKNKNIKIPKWYTQIGTFTIFGAENGDILQNNNNNAEFIPYHAAELSINLEAYYCLKNAMDSNKYKDKNCEQLMDELGIIDNPFIFFHEMKQVLMNVNQSIYGLSINNNKIHNEFDKYLQSKWKELKVCLHDVQNTNSTDLYFYLPLLDFKQFLNSIQVVK